VVVFLFLAIGKKRCNIRIKRKSRALSSEGFFEKVRRIVENIPYGKVAIYGQIAYMPGN